MHRLIAIRMYTLSTSFLLLAMATVAHAQSVAPAPGLKPDSGPNALLIIDIQNFYFPNGKLPLVAPLEASLQAKRLLEHFRAKGWPVVHVQHRPAAQAAPRSDPDDNQYRIHPNVLPLPGETVIVKHHANAFRDTELEAVLRRLGVKKLFISGMQTHMCVEAATRAAADLGFEVTVVHDACATRALKFKDVEVPAEQVHAAALAAMSGNYARVLSTEELLSELR